MNPTLIIWLEFTLCAALIGVAGLRLSRYGDVIATHIASRDTDLTGSTATVVAFMSDSLLLKNSSPRQ
jgi:hypothetical protein